MLTAGVVCIWWGMSFVLRVALDGEPRSTLISGWVPYITGLGLIVAGVNR